MIKRSRGGWMVVERVPPTRDGKRIRKWVPTLLEVAKLLEPQAPQVETRDAGPTMKEFSIEFLRRHEPARKDPRTYGSNTRILLEHFGETIRLGEISVAGILDFRIKRIEKDGVEDFVTNRQVATLSAMFEAARLWETWSGENPCRKVKPFEEPPARDRVFSAEEVQRILAVAAADQPFYAMIQAALYSGLRKGALRTLQWTDVRDGFIVVRKENAKGKRRTIEIPIHPELQQILDGLERDGVFIFHEDGQPFSDETIRSRWARVIRDAKVVDARGSRFHDLRRTAGTAAMERGLGTGMIQRILGHQQAATTERYLHADRRARRAAVPFLGPPRPDPSTPSDTRGQGQDEEREPVSSASGGENPKRRG